MYSNFESETPKQPRLKLVDPSSPAYMLAQFDPNPGTQIKKKVDYFFRPYGQELHQKKCMQF